LLNKFQPSLVDLVLTTSLPEPRTPAVYHGPGPKSLLLFAPTYNNKNKEKKPITITGSSFGGTKTTLKPSKGTKPPLEASQGDKKLP
jgi:hypothetical protein